MAQVKLMKIDSDGVLIEMNTGADDVTLNSYTVQGGGAVLSSTGLDLNDTALSDASDISFNDPSADGFTITDGTFAANEMFFESKQNDLTTAGGIAFPVIADSVGEVDAFRLPALAGVPSASPTNGGEGHLIWNSTGDKLYAWDGSAWKDLSVVSEAGLICNSYTADEALTANDAVYISAADNVSKAQGVTGAISRMIGFAGATTVDTDPVNVCSEGVMSGFSGLTAGSRYYLSPATAGLITSTLPVGSGNTIVAVGYAKSATALHIHIEQLGRRA